MRKYDPLNIIRIRNSEGSKHSTTLLPEDFGNAVVIRALFSPEDRRMFALLRTVGFSSAESFGATFSKALVMHPDAMAAAAQVYEESPHAKRELLEVLASVNPQTRDVELDRNVGSLVHAAADAAMSLRVALVDYTPDPEKERKAIDFVRLKNLLDARAAEIEQEAALEHSSDSEIDWSRSDGVTKFNAGGTNI